MKKPQTGKKREERFSDVHRAKALGAGACYHCGLAIYADDDIIWATREPIKLVVAFHDHCWEGKPPKEKSK